MTMMRRQGECNRCGECCADFPWGEKPLQRMRSWRSRDVAETFPVLKMFGGFRERRDEARHQHETLPRKSYGNVKIGRERHHFIWIDGGVLTDLAPYGDESTTSPACPFLTTAEDGARPCALVGTRYEKVWKAACQPEPPELKSQHEVTDWQANHPSCSYTWEPE
jgi:hypothetical protein